MTATVRISLPFPVSVNAMYMRTRSGVIRSKRYRIWHEAAGWTLATQRPAKIQGPVNICIDLVAPDRRTRDADNLAKCVLDLLVEHQVIEADDSRIVRRALPGWVESGEPCVVTVTACERVAS